MSVAPHSDDASGGAAPQLPPGCSQQHSHTADAMGLPAVQGTPCQGRARFGVQGKGTDLAVIVPRPEYACTETEHVRQKQMAVIGKQKPGSWLCCGHNVCYQEGFWVAWVVTATVRARSAQPWLHCMEGQTLSALAASHRIGC